jgi:hypothetical protein
MPVVLRQLSPREDTPGGSFTRHSSLAGLVSYIAVRVLSHNGIIDVPDDMIDGGAELIAGAIGLATGALGMAWRRWVIGG